MRVELHGQPPAHIREILAHAGLQIEPGSDELHLIWPDDEGRAAIAQLAARGRPTLAILEDPEQYIDAVLAGASAVISGTDPQRLRVELECFVRLRNQLTGNAATPELAEQALLSESLVRTSPDPIICADPRGQVVLFSPAAEASLGYTRAYATAQLHVTDVYANPADARRVLSEIRISPDGVLRDFPVRLRARSGEHIPVLLSATEIGDDDGGTSATVGIFRDQRVEHELRTRLSRATQQLILSEQRASAASSTKATAHELNQPLTALMGALELIDLRSDLHPDIRKRLERMYSQLERMAEIVRGLGQQALREGSHNE